MLDVNTNATPTGVSDSVSADETLLCAPWVVFASGQGLRDEYGTVASAGITATLEEEVSTLCREFHNALGVQEVPDGSPVVLFWKSHTSSHYIITQVRRAPHQPGQRIAYEYFSFVFSPSELDKVGGNPLQALELMDGKQLREHWSAGFSDPICAPIDANHTADIQPVQAPRFSQNGTWPATEENREMLLAYLNSGEASGRTFATWWPGAKPPTAGVFDIVLLCEAMRTARPHEIVALATELNHSLSRNLLAPPSYDNEGARCYRALLHDAGEIEAMLKEAYFPAALEESPHRWMTRPQKVAGLCQKIADGLPDYIARLPASFSDEIAIHCTELASRYAGLARDLQKLRHPNMLHQSQKATVTGAPNTTEQQLGGTLVAKHKGMQFALFLAGLLVLLLLGFGVRTMLGKSNAGNSNAGRIRPHLTGSTSPGSEEKRRDEQALRLMRTRAEREVFRVAYTLAAQRAAGGKGMSKEMMQRTVVDAVAQAMLQTPHAQIKSAQKHLLFRIATEPIRAKAMQGVRAGAGQRNTKQSAAVPSTLRRARS